MIGKSFSSRSVSALRSPASPASRDIDFVGIEELSAEIGHRHLYCLAYRGLEISFKSFQRFHSICERVFFRTGRFEPVKLSES